MQLNFKKGKITAIFLILSSFAFSQTPSISASNGEAYNASSVKTTKPCGICTPLNWKIVTGTPDMSNRTTTASTTTAGGGTSWINTPLSLPPNGHTDWITIRDIADQKNEEAIKTTMTGLTIGREYEIVIYTLTALNSSYSPRYIDQFDFQVSGYNRVKVTKINKDIDKKWGVNRLVFEAKSTSMDLTFYPGYNTNASNFESVNISVSLNAINTIPVGQKFSQTINQDQTASFDVVAVAVEYDSNQIVQKNSIDLDPDTDGIQSTVINKQGTWIADQNGIVTFTPTPGFGGKATIFYTIEDNYMLDGVLSPGTSTPKSISVLVLPCTTGIKGTGFSLKDGETKTYNMPATDYGFIFDIYTLDNSFQLNINGVNLANQEIDFQSGSGSNQNIKFSDGTEYGVGTNPADQIYNIIGDSISPAVRVTINPNGQILMYGRKNSTDKQLYDLVLSGTAKFNNIIWNTTQPNTVIVSQNVVGATNISGYGSGLKKILCPCTKPPTIGTPTGFSNVAISTNTIIDKSWPSNIPNGALVLDSSTKGMVITRIANVETDIVKPVTGMIAYDEVDKCVKLFNGTEWDCLNQTCNQ